MCVRAVWRKESDVVLWRRARGEGIGLRSGEGEGVEVLEMTVWGGVHPLTRDCIDDPSRDLMTILIGP